MKRSYADDAQLFAKVFDLLDRVFPGLLQAAEEIRVFGTSWESASTPYILTADDRVVSHVGVIALPLVVCGRRVSVGSIHAVATHPDFRRRGLYRQLMTAVLEDCAGGFETLILTTENPGYYEPHGFRRVGEHYFTVRGPFNGGKDGGRLLSARSPNDLAVLRRLLETRAPVSETLGVLNASAVFCFNEGARPLLYMEDLGILACIQLEGRRLHLFDIVGPTIPPLASVMARIPHAVAEVVVHFSPDRLAVEAEATPYIPDLGGPSYLMVRGPFAAEDQPFALPRSART